MAELEQLLDSKEIAEMLEIEHWQLLRKLNGRTGSNGKHIKGYVEILGDNQVVVTDFFRESTYKTEQNKEMPCYQVTRKGCEFLANKFTGEKGVIFTARYINRFHEMQDILSKKQVEPELPWFIQKFRGKHIMLFRDFKSLTGVEIYGNYTACKRTDKLEGGLDYNGWAWHTAVNREEFKKEYGFDYGDDKCMMYLYPRGITKALEIYRRESGRKMIPEAYNTISFALKTIAKIEKPSKIKLQTPKKEFVSVYPFVQIQVFGNPDCIISAKQ